MSSFSFRILSIATALSAITLSSIPPASFAQSVSDSALTSTPANYPMDVDGAEIRLSTTPYNGDLTITGSNVVLLLDPGKRVVNGNVNIDSSGDVLLVSFNNEKQHGSLEINGSLVLGPNYRPTLALDLNKVGNLVPGETFIIVSANTIRGQFNGLNEGETFQIGDVKLRISYADNSVVITVVSTNSRLDPYRTPVIEIDNSLINPTSTAPGQW